MESDDIENFLNNFEETEKTNYSPPVDEKIEPENYEAYISEKVNKLTDLSMESIEEVKDIAIASGNGETITALASLITAASKQLEILSKLTLQKENIKSKHAMQDKDLKHKEKIVDKKLEHEKLLSNGQNDAPALQQNNFYINASREEIMDRLLTDIKQKVDQHKILEAEEIST